MNEADQCIRNDTGTHLRVQHLNIGKACGYCFRTVSSDPNSQVKVTPTSQLPQEKQQRILIYQKMHKNYKEHMIDPAFRQISMYKELCRKTGYQMGSAEEQLVTTIEQQMQDLLYFERVLNEEGWQLQKEQQNLQVSTKIQGNTVGVLIEALLDVPVQHFLSTIVEIDLMKHFMPFMLESKLQKVVSRNCRIGHCINDFPFISKRQAFFMGIGYDRVDHNNTILMYSRSLNDRPDLQEKFEYQVKQTKGAVQLDYKYLIIEYAPYTRTTGKLRFAINIDIKVRLPLFILIPASEGFGVDFYKNLRKVAHNFKGSEWERKTKQNPAFFDLVNRRIEDYFTREQ